MRLKRNYIDLLKELVKTDFKLRYKNSVLGLVWVLLKPFLSFLILYLIFGYLFGNQDPNYRLNLLIGLITFQFFTEATSRGLAGLVSRANILLKINFPREIALLAPIINAIINYTFSLIIFFIFWFFNPTPLTWWWLVAPMYFFLLVMFVIGFSLFTSILYVRLRDLETIWEVLSTLIFYATPIIYPISLLPEKFQSIILLNPVAAIIRDIRLILIQGRPPGVFSIIYVGGVSLLMILFGWLYFRKQIKRVSEDF